MGKVICNGLVNDLPVLALVSESNCLDGLFSWMDHEITGIRTRILSDQSLLTSSKVHCEERCSVTIAAIDHVENRTGLVEPDDSRCEQILHCDLHKRLPALLLGCLEYLASAVRRESHRKADVILIVGCEFHKTLVLHDKTLLTSCDVETVDVVKLRIAIVEGD